ncbi:MAG: hypothetical protein IJR97_11480 [Clostridia bacterium]|nr:hypothetical protein [Clostridia bacterium]
MKTRIMIILAAAVMVIVLAAAVIFPRGTEKNRIAADAAVSAPDIPETVEGFGDLSDEETNEQLIRLADEMEVVPDKE